MRCTCLRLFGLCFLSPSLVKDCSTHIEADAPGSCNFVHRNIIALLVRGEEITDKPVVRQFAEATYSHTGPRRCRNDPLRGMKVNEPAEAASHQAGGACNCNSTPLVSRQHLHSCLAKSSLDELTSCIGTAQQPAGGPSLKSLDCGFCSPCGGWSTCLWAHHAQTETHI